MRVLTCIVCPKGCSLQLEKNGESISVSGALCRKGEAYAVQEMTNPHRSLQSTIKSTIPGQRRAAVKTSAEVPLKDIFLFMQEINKVELHDKKACGEVIFYGLCGTDVNLILTERLN